MKGIMNVIFYCCHYYYFIVMYISNADNDIGNKQK